MIAALVLLLFGLWLSWFSRKKRWLACIVGGVTLIPAARLGPSAIVLWLIGFSWFAYRLERGHW